MPRAPRLTGWHGIPAVRQLGRKRAPPSAVDERERLYRASFALLQVRPFGMAFLLYNCCCCLSSSSSSCNIDSRASISPSSPWPRK